MLLTPAQFRVWVAGQITDGSSSQVAQLLGMTRDHIRRCQKTIHAVPAGQESKKHAVPAGHRPNAIGTRARGRDYFRSRVSIYKARKRRACSPEERGRRGTGGLGRKNGLPAPERNAIHLLYDILRLLKFHSLEEAVFKAKMPERSIGKAIALFAPLSFWVSPNGLTRDCLEVLVHLEQAMEFWHSMLY